MEERKFKNLLKPMRIGNTVFKNRMLASPTSVPTLDKLGHLTPQNIAYFEEKAKGGFASVTLGECLVYSKDGLTHNPQTVLDDPSAVPCLMEVAEAIHSHNALASLELTHGGALSKPAFNNNQNPIGPSAMITPQGYTVEEMSEEKIIEISEAFGKAAAFAKGCGFDMCLIHGGHGWLLSQFLSPLFNTRTDKYGGSIENRVRFPLMVIDSIRRHAGKDFLIEYRFSGDEFKEGGYTIEDGIEIAKHLDGKVDLIHVSAGVHLLEPTLVKMHPSIFHSQGENVYLAEAIKKNVSTPVVTIGALSDPEFMEDVLASGKADFVSMGRQTLADPYLPKKVLRNQIDDIRPCVRCLECMGASLGFGPVELHCTVNPVTGRELKTQYISPAKNSRKVLIGGGGPAGMMAAITAADRGHKVILCEESSRLGGALNVAEGVEFKSRILAFRDYLIKQIEKRDIEICLNSALDKNKIKDINPDVVIAAFGSEPIVPPIPGNDRKGVIYGGGDAENTNLGSNVVIIGGGLVGCELAVNLKNKGHVVSLVEMLDDVAKDAKLFHRIALLDQLKGINIFRNSKCIEILENVVKIQLPDGNIEELAADNVVLATGLKSKLGDVDELREIANEFVCIGDGNKIGKIMTAVRAGYDAAIDID